MTFVELVAEVSSRCDMAKKDVARVLRAMQEEVKGAVNSGERVKFRGFGSFYGAKVGDKKFIRFRQYRRKTMEKLGVILDDEKVKTASTKLGCPMCGAPLISKDGIASCPVHGTEPFEKRPDGK